MMSEVKLSHTKGDSSENDLPDRTTFTYLDKWASLQPETEAYVFRPSETERESINWSDLKTASENLAVWFRREYALRKGDRVGILSVNRLAYVLLEFALPRIGLVLVRLYVTMDSETELKRHLNATDCRLLLCQYDSLKSFTSILESRDPSRRLESDEFPKLEHVICLTGETSPGTVPLPDWRSLKMSDEELEELYLLQSSITIQDDCTIYLTSGSTGLPKYVVQSQGGVLSLPPLVAARSGLTSGDRYFIDRPMSHSGGNAMSAIRVGATMIISNTLKTVGGMSDYVLTVMKEERVNCGLSFPYILYDFVSSEESARKFRSLNAKFFIIAGQLSNPEILKIVKTELGIPMVNGYGTTEIGEICCTKLSDSFDVISRYTGLPIGSAEVKIVEPETRAILPRGQIGSIAIKRHHKWYYLNNEAKMQESFDQDGFFYPGDMGRMADNGYLEIVGRSDDMMSVGTVKIYPAPIEAMLLQHPLVDKALVFGVPDPRLGEVIGAAVMVKPGLAAVTSEGILGSFEKANQSDLMTGSTFLPKFVWIEDSFPKTISGKIDKKTLKERCLRKLEK